MKPTRSSILDNLWQWIAALLAGALLGGIPAYFAIVNHAIGPDEVRSILEREYKPAVAQTYDEVRGLRVDVGTLQRQNAALEAKMDLLLKKYAVANEPAARPARHSEPAIVAVPVLTRASLVKRSAGWLVSPFRPAFACDSAQK